MSHIAPISMKVAATLTAFRGVTCTTSTGGDIAKYPASAAERPVGITNNDVTDITQAIPVIIAGIAKLEFASAVTSGNLVALNSVGQGVAHTDVTAGSYYVGTLLGPTAVTGTIADVLVNPGFKSIP